MSGDARSSTELSHSDTNVAHKSRCCYKNFASISLNKIFCLCVIFFAQSLIIIILCLKWKRKKMMPRTQFISSMWYHMLMTDVITFFTICFPLSLSLCSYDVNIFNSTFQHSSVTARIRLLVWFASLWFPPVSGFSYIFLLLLWLNTLWSLLASWRTVHQK